MEVQVFGTRKCKDTQKALRFWKERRIRVHFVDLAVRGASRGELGRFLQKFGVEALLNREAKRFRELGLHTASLTEARILALLEQEPMLLRTPLVRQGNRLTVGMADAEWKAWAAE